MADAAICINPNDERYTHLHGKKVLLPLMQREIPIILDDLAKMKDGALLANSGHFDIEIDIKALRAMSKRVEKNVRPSVDGYLLKKNNRTL